MQYDISYDSGTLIIKDVGNIIVHETVDSLATLNDVKLRNKQIYWISVNADTTVIVSNSNMYTPMNIDEDKIICLMLFNTVTQSVVPVWISFRYNCDFTIAYDKYVNITVPLYCKRYLCTKKAM